MDACGALQLRLGTHVTSDMSPEHVLNILTIDKALINDIGSAVAASKWCFQTTTQHFLDPKFTWVPTQHLVKVSNSAHPWSMPGQPSSNYDHPLCMQ